VVGYRFGGPWQVFLMHLILLSSEFIIW